MFSKKLRLVLLAPFFFSACSYSTFYVPVERLVYAPSSGASVAVSTQKTVKAPHKILGRVAAIAWGGGDSARDLIQDEAARLGANLIIDLRLERGFGRTSASGLAVLMTPENNSAGGAEF